MSLFLIHHRARMNEFLLKVLWDVQLIHCYVVLHDGVDDSYYILCNGVDTPGLLGCPKSTQKGLPSFQLDISVPPISPPHPHPTPPYPQGKPHIQALLFFSKADKFIPTVCAQTGAFIQAPRHKKDGGPSANTRRGLLGVGVWTRYPVPHPHNGSPQLSLAGNRRG